MGATDPKKAKEGTIRKIYGISIDKNSVHGSDSVENAKLEIKFFFQKLIYFVIFIIASEKAIYSRFLSFFFNCFNIIIFIQIKNFFKIILPASSFSFTK